MRGADRRRSLRQILAAAVLAVLAQAAGSAPIEEIVRLPSEDGAVLPYLLSTDDSRPAQVAAVLFTGGPGTLGLLRKGIPRPGANFLVRERHRFLEQGIATAVIDVPSDTQTMSDRFRSSARHARDVAAVVADLKARLPEVRVYLAGTSRGTVSAAYGAATLGNAVAGVVLSSSVFTSSNGGGLGLALFDYGSIRAPLLFVHHVDDSCPVTPYAAAAKLAARYPLISVSGGDPPKSDACEPFSPHGYYGVEAPTVAAMSRWMLGLDYPKRVP